MDAKTPRFGEIASPKTVGFSPEGLARVDHEIGELIATGELAGAVILVARHGRVAHRAALGLKDLARREPLENDSIFRIYSMTKPVTAVAMMILFEEGRWSPDDPIAKHLPEFAAVRGPGGAAPDHAPTMRELLTHTGGFAYGVGPGPHDAADKSYIDLGVWKAPDLAEMSRRVAQAPLAYQPGSAWRYSISMDLQGAIIERLTGESLPDFMRSRIFTPLGMIDTDFYVPKDKLPRLATLYHKFGASELTVLDNPGFVRDPATIPPIAMGGGGLFSTALDYARLGQMLLNRGELEGARILKPESVATLTANHLPEAIITRGVDAGFQKIGPGRGYGYNGAVFYDPKAAGSPVGRGTYQWDGASGVWFWIDPENGVLFVGMIQRMLQDGMAPLQSLTQKMIAEALV